MKKIEKDILVEADKENRKKQSMEDKKDSYSALLDVICEGENYLRQTHRSEVKTFDDDFIVRLEDGIQAIARIVANPRTFIKEHQDIINAELAKKVSSLSLRHISTNSQYIRDIDADGNVVPSKILTIQTETDLAIYENRFVMTLIKRCMLFIQMRYNWIKEHGETFDSDLLLLHNKTVINGVIYEVDSRIKMSIPSTDAGNSEKNRDLLNRLTELRNLCDYFLHTPFMDSLRGVREVSSPIHRTNMIVKHPDYHKAYELWNFLEAYEELGISYDVKETDQEFCEEYKKELSKNIANSILLLNANPVDLSKLTVSRHNVYNPEIIFDLEDVTYMDGKYLFDAYPDAKERENPLAPLPSEAKQINEEIKERIKEQKKIEKVVKKSITQAKDEYEMEEANKRIQNHKEVEQDIESLLKKIKELEKENQRLKQKSK